MVSPPHKNQPESVGKIIYNRLTAPASNLACWHTL